MFVFVCTGARSGKGGSPSVFVVTVLNMEGSGSPKKRKSINFSHSRQNRDKCETNHNNHTFKTITIIFSLESKNLIDEIRYIEFTLSCLFKTFLLF